MRIMDNLNADSTVSIDRRDMRVSRRTVLGGMAASLAAGSVASLEPTGLALKLLGPAEGQGMPRARRIPLQEFGYEQVTVSGKQQCAQLANVRAILLGFDDDSLLKPFRQMSGRPGPGQSLGGWYEWKPDYDYRHDNVGFCPGASFGQWVSAMARIHTATGDPALGEKAVRLNGLLAETIAQGDFHAYFAQTRFPAYTFDKLLCGLMDAQRLAGDTTAFATLDKVRAAAEPELPGHAEDRDVQAKRRGTVRDISWSWDESYTMSENLYLVSTQMPPAQAANYRAMAAVYLDDAYFLPLARAENALAGKHAYSYVNALCSAMQAYLTAGSAMHLNAARNGFDLLARQSYATGGWGPDEQLRGPGPGDVSAALDTSLVKTHNSFETPCGSYAHMKLTRYLLRATGDSRYGDSMERMMLNTVMGSLPLESDGRSFYYADYNDVGKRVYSNYRWPCCSGTLPQVVADYGINTYLREPSAGGQPAAVWVNLYQPSELRWREGNASLRLKQTSAYPETGEVRLEVSATQPTRFVLRLRVPAWAGSQAQLRINGINQSVAPPGAAIGKEREAHPDAGYGFVSLDRVWRTGDRVELLLPLTLRLEPLPGKPAKVALLCGPLVLFALRGPSDTGALSIPSEALLSAQRVGPRAWRVQAGARSWTFVPFTEVGEQPYSTYVDTRVV